MLKRENQKRKNPQVQREFEVEDYKQESNSSGQAFINRQKTSAQEPPNLIESTTLIDLSEMQGQVDFLAPVGDNTFIVGSTIG